jgi:hypothetical protein
LRCALAVATGTNRLADFGTLDNHIFMTRKQIESAVASRIPFKLRMADGKEYPVPHPDYISLPPSASYVIVYDYEGRFTVLPLLTMTVLESSLPDASKKE